MPIDKLRQYRAKRDFKRTSKPRSVLSGRAAAQLA